MLERDVEQPAVRWAKAHGVKQRKLNGMGARDWPDRAFFFPNGKLLIIEFKAPGKQANPNQQECIDDLKLLGYDVHVIDNKEKGLALLAATLEACGVPAQGQEVAGKQRVRGAVPRPRVAKNQLHPSRVQGTKGRRGS